VPKILHTTVHTTVGFGYPLGVQTRHYILDELGNPKPEPDLLTHARWWAANEHRARVAESQVGPARISTVFLKSDWNFSFKGGPPSGKRWFLAAGWTWSACDAAGRSSKPKRCTSEWRPR